MIKGKNNYWRACQVYRFLGICSRTFYNRQEQGEYENIECIFDGVNCWYKPFDVVTYAFPELTNTEKAKLIIEFNTMYGKHKSTARKRFKT